MRSTWDWWHRRDEFVAWARSVPRLANPAPVVEWSTDKRYLAELPHTIPTTFLEQGATYQVADCSEKWIVKPTQSAGAADTFAVDGDGVGEAVARIHALGKVAMVQPYLHGVDERGETALLYFGGRFSHAVRKKAVLSSPRGDDGLYPIDQLAPREPTPDELRVADDVLAAVGDDLVYARVDLVPGDDGQPLLLELEVAEPSLFLRHGEGAERRFADALVAATLAP